MESYRTILALVFWAYLISALIIVAVSGGRNGRRFSAALVVAVVCTFLANEFLGFKGAQHAVLAIDTILGAYVVALALRSASHWPLWFAGFHMITVATGLARLFSPRGIPELYVDTAGFWAFPALGAAVIGVMLDRRAGLIRSASFDPA